MAIYYKGLIVLTDEMQSLDYSGKLAYVSYGTVFIDDYFQIKNKENIRILDRFLQEHWNNNPYKEVEVTGIIKDILNKELKNKNEIINMNGSYQYLNIIFELVKGKDNILYAKELHSGLIFPVFKNKDILLTNYKINYKNNHKLYSDNYFYELTVNRKISFSSLNKLGSIIINAEICDQNELDEYLNRFNKRIFSKKRKKDFFRALRILYNKNIFKEDFKIKEDIKKEQITRVKKSVGTNLMENIEYLLLNLKSNNQELYLNFKNKYEELLKTTNLNYQVLALFEGEIEASLLFGTNGVHDILEYLTNLKKEYLDNFLNNNKEKTDLTFEKINKINELFLKVKDKYSLLNQREVLKDLAFLYLMEVYENKEIISLEVLEDSYFADNLKSIVIWIKSLQDIGLIECNYLIDLVDDLSCSVVFDIIKGIKFNLIQEDEFKKLIKI